MNAVEYFNKIQEIERHISAASRRVMLFKAMAEKITASLDGEQVVHSRNVHSSEDAILRLSEAKDELERLSADYSLLVSEITEKMTNLDPEEEDLLTYHYLKHLPLLAVAREMNRGKTWVYEHHVSAIRNLNLILSKAS